MFERGVTLDQIQRPVDGQDAVHYGEEFDVTKTGMANCAHYSMRMNEKARQCYLKIVELIIALLF